MAKVGLIDDSRPVGGHQMSPAGDKRFGARGKAVANHIQHRGNDQLVGAQIAIGIDDIDRNALLPEWPVVFINGIFILHPEITRALRIIQRPAVLLVKNNRHFGVGTTANHARQAAEHLSQPADFAADAGIQVPDVVNDRAVEFLHRATALTPLKVLNRIRAVGDRLH